MRISVDCHFVGSYRLRNLLEWKSTRRISTSYFVARLAMTTPTTNRAIPPKSECSREKIAPPEIRATKNNRRSAPRTVNGRFMALITGLTLPTADLDIDHLLSFAPSPET